MRTWSWNGARWWKVDLHTHTPASKDYGKNRPDQAELQQRDPKEWLLDFMRAGLDCVAVTDHNSGAWIDRLRQALRELVSERPAGYRSIHLFPGVEISVHGGVHLLAILEAHATTSDVDSLLGAAGFSGIKGSSDAVTSEPFQRVVAEIQRAPGIAIPAHADGPNGLFQQLQGQTLGQAIRCEDVSAIEILDPSTAKPGLYTHKTDPWTEIEASDSHHPSGQAGQRFPGSHFTWIKMGPPSLEGLRLALLDGPLSVRRCDEASDDPNEHAQQVIESIEVSQARFMGRREPFKLCLNPWLNAVIGGRGTGKSTLVEFLRLALRKQGELPDALRPEFEKYAKLYLHREDSGLLTENTVIRVIYRKDNARFRIQWSPSGTLAPIEEEYEGTWRATQGDIKQRFPAKIYSQKQVFQLAKNPLALLREVDDAPAVKRRLWDERWRAEESRFLSLRAKTRELGAGLAEEEGLRGELDDVRRKLKIFEQADHADVLKAFQKRSRQQRSIEHWEAGWTDLGDRLRRLSGEIVPDPLDEAVLDPEAAADFSLHKSADEARNRLAEIADSVRRLAQEADLARTEWQETKRSSPWQGLVTKAIQTYEELREELAQEGVGEPAVYGQLVQQRQTIERRLQELTERRRQIEELKNQAEGSLARLRDLRQELTESRATFVESVLEDNRYVNIRVLPYGARDSVELALRRLLHKEDASFAKDIECLLSPLYGEDEQPKDFATRLSDLKRRVRDIARGEHDSEELSDQRFATHIARLEPEALDRLDAWFPKDSLDVQYSTTTDGKNFRSIQEGSPGQRTAALLAFLLSYGDEPLVLDQPEDDLDNHLIYELIVTQLREVKPRRQVLVVSHNPNIVVNGDAELVVALDSRSGETRKACEGSLQDPGVRATVCKVMEGGFDAFKQRYRRIALEGRHV